MPMRFATCAALCLALGVVAYATAAYADNGYQPYYMQDRDSFQFSQVQPPSYHGVEQQSPQVVGHPVPYQAPQVTTATPPEVAQAGQWESQPPLFHYNNEVWASAGTSLLNYEESVTPLPDSEHGWLPSIAVGGSYMTQDNLYFAAQGSDTFGNAHYNGALFTSPSTPIETTTRETITNAEGKIGQGFYLASQALLIPYLDVGFRYWERNLGGGEIEDYHNFSTLAGLMLEVSPFRNVFLSAYGSAGTTLGGRMETGSLSYQLGDSAIYKVGGKIGVDLTRQVELFTTFDYDHFHYSQSPVVNSTLEPGSFTNDTTMRVGLGYHFR
jgi:hypothetical protein